MSCQNGDYLYEMFDPGNFPDTSHLPVRRAYEAVRYSSESSSDEEHWNTFQLFKFSISNQNSSTPKKIGTPARRPNGSVYQSPMSTGRSEVDSSSSLAYVTCPEISTNQNSEVNLEKKCSADQPCLSKEIPENAKSTEKLSEHWNTFQLFKFSISNQNSSTPKKMGTPARRPNGSVYQSPMSTGRSEVDSSSSLAYVTCPEISTNQNSEVNLENKCSADQPCLSKKIPENAKSTEKLPVVDGGVDESTQKPSTNAPGSSEDNLSVSLSCTTNPKIKPQQLSSCQNFKELNLNCLDTSYLTRAINVVIPKPLGILNFIPPWDRNNAAVVVNDLVNYRFRDTFDKLMDKFKKQRLALAEAHSRMAAYRNMNKPPFGVELQDLRYIDDSCDDETNSSVSDDESSISTNFSEDQEVTADDEVETKYSESEEVKSRKNSMATKYSFDFDLLCLKLQAIKDTYESEAENLQNCYDSFISSENEDSNNEIDVHSEEAQNTLVNNTYDAGRVNQNINPFSNSSASSEDNSSIGLPCITNPTNPNNNTSDDVSYISIEFINEQEAIPSDEDKKETLGSEEAKSRVEAQKHNSLDLNLLCLKLQALNDSCENRDKNLQDSHHGSILSENKNSFEEKVSTHSEEFPKTFKKNVVNVDSVYQYTNPPANSLASSEDDLSIGLPYITYSTNTSNYTSDNVSYISIEFINEQEVIPSDEDKKETLGSEEVNSRVETPKSTKYNLNLDLLCLKLQALNDSYENRAKNLQDRDDGSITSENENSYKEKIVTNDETRSAGYQKTLIKNVDNSGSVNQNTNRSTNLPCSLENGSSTSLPCVTNSKSKPQPLSSSQNCKELNLDQHSLDKSYLTKEVNLAMPKPLDVLSFVPRWDQKNTAVVVNDLVNYRYKNTFDELMDKLKKQRLASAESQSRKALHRNVNKRPFGKKPQDLRYIDDSFEDETKNDVPENESSTSIEFTKEEKVITDDEVKKQNSFSEEAKSELEAQMATNYSPDFNLVSLKLQAAKNSYGSKAKNLQDGYDGSMSSENEEINKEVITNVEVHSEESQKTLVNNVGNADRSYIQTIDYVTVNGNMEIMETQQHINDIIGNDVSKTARITSDEQNEVLEAEPKPSNQSKVNFSSELNETSFLRTEDELIKGLQKSVSVGTDDVNYLLSLAYCRNNQTANNEATLLSNLTFNSYSPSPDFTTQNVRFSYPSYAEVSGYGFNPNTEEGQKHLRKHININEEIVKQVTKLLVFGSKNRPQFLGSFVHLDGEKILLVAKTRRDALLNHLYKVSEPAGETSATIVLEELVCQLHLQKNEPFSPKVEHYYMCILEHKTTIYSTSIKLANEYGCIIFQDRFIFENVTNTFDIKVSLYSLTIKLSTGKCMGICLIKRRPQEVPMMTLIGVVRIGLLNAKYNKFSFKKPDNVEGPEHKLLTTVRATLNWPKAVKGFLTMGFSQSDRQPTWNKRWIVLEDGQLKYFNFPSDELFCSPIGVVDIRECASIESSPFKYMMRRTVMLLFINSNQNTAIKLYICADTSEEQLMWLEKFTAIIKLKNDWRGLKK